MMTSDCLPHQVLAALERSLLEPQGVRAGEVRSRLSALDCNCSNRKACVRGRCDGVRWSAMECDGVRWNAMECDGMRWSAMECDGVRLIAIDCDCEGMRAGRCD